jgi:hypothetical protein
MSVRGAPPLRGRRRAVAQLCRTRDGRGRLPARVAWAMSAGAARPAFAALAARFLCDAHWVGWVRWLVGTTSREAYFSAAITTSARPYSSLFWSRDRDCLDRTQHCVGVAVHRRTALHGEGTQRRGTKKRSKSRVRLDWSVSSFAPPDGSSGQSGVDRCFGCSRAAERLVTTGSPGGTSSPAAGSSDHCWWSTATTRGRATDPF